MGESLHVDPEGLRAYGAAFLHAADRAQQIFDRLTDALSEAGPCWGDDEPGKQFAEHYTPDADRTVAGFREVTRALRELGDAVTGASSSYNDADVDSAGRITETGDVSGRPRDDEPPPWYRTAAANDRAADDPTGTVDPGRPSTLDSTGTPSTHDAPGTVVAHGASTRHADESAFEPSGSPFSAGPPQNAAAAGPEDRGTQPRPGPGIPAPTPAADGSPPFGDQPPQAAPLPPRSAARVGGGGQARVSGPAGTPWSGPPGTSTPWSGSESPPRPSSRLPAGRPHRSGRERRRHVAVSTNRDPRVLIAEALAARRGIAVMGFDAPHVGEGAVRQFAAAVDDLLDAYPALGLRTVRIAELEETDVVLAVRDSTAVETIVLNRRWAADPQRLSAVSASPGPVYDAVVHEVGRAAVDLAARSAAEARRR